MSRQSGHIYDHSGTDSGNNYWPDDNKSLSPDDSELFELAGEYMMGYLDLEDVRNDPYLSGSENIAREMINDYHNRINVNKADETFIRDAVLKNDSEKSIEKEIRKIKQEIETDKIDLITAEWVKEWEERRDRDSGREAHTQDISDFITNSLNYDTNEPETEIRRGEKRGLSRTLLRYTSVAAAAIIIVVILVRTLLPSNSPERLFDTYYTPFKAIALVTRNSNQDLSDSYSRAVEKYRLGDYQGAAMGFSEAVERDNLAIEPRFFMGITELALGNFDRAIDLLSVVSESSAGYSKEAKWYLGLAYLRTGEIEKASSCFEFLAQAPGSYRLPAEKIVRRLK
jgi:tetratricopeptide (TPR) repeat protein